MEWMGNETPDHWRATPWRTTTSKRETYLMIPGWTNSGTRCVCVQRRRNIEIYFGNCVILCYSFFFFVESLWTFYGSLLLLVDENLPQLLDQIKEWTSISHKKDKVQQMFYKVTVVQLRLQLQGSHPAAPVVFECSFYIWHSNCSLVPKIYYFQKLVLWTCDSMQLVWERK